MSSETLLILKISLVGIDGQFSVVRFCMLQVCWQQWEKAGL